MTLHEHSDWVRLRRLFEEDQEPLTENSSHYRRYGWIWVVVAYLVVLGLVIVVVTR